MKKLAFTLFLFSFCLFSFGQNKSREGKVIYIVTYEQNDSSKSSSKPSTAVVHFSKNMLRMEMQTGNGIESVTLIDLKAKKSTMLFEISGKKYAVVNNKPDRKTIRDAKKQKPILYKNESKIIAGYNCKRADVELKNDKMYSVFYTTEIDSRNATFNSPLYEIDGFLMEFWVNSGNQIVKMSATEITLEPIDKILFKVPDEYTVTSREELRNLFQSK